MINLETARQLLDFSTRMGPGQRAEEQLQGAVAIHNLLEMRGVAYLADEVGMGKTYVALGALALFRHFNPGFRVLVVAPRANIQRKWMKEQRNFVEHNYLVSDMRVKGLDQRPAQRMVFCNSLLDLVRETALDPDRDFYARMSSFSLALAGRGALTLDNVRRQRDALRAHLPWLKEDVFDLRSKRAFKDNFASAICCALPVFDLVIIDEGHNLKHGFSPSSAARNRTLSLAFGRNPEAVDRRLFPRYGPRAKRLLLLSATPVEGTYTSLWNQLDVFGLTRGFEPLQQPEADEDQKKQVARQMLIRRVTTITVAGESLTKNQYRREWRAGGVATYNDPIRVTDPKQRLAVALVQKKVSELLNSDRFNASFQIGMLASFESFLETAKVKATPNGGTMDTAEEDAAFDDANQTDIQVERDGIDVEDVNHIAKSYRRRFDAELPHPKMDALVQSLSDAWSRGEKALVFVRRVASVKELRRKLNESYDAWLLARLRAELPAAVQPRLEGVIKQYRAAKREMLEADADADPSAEGPGTDASDRGGADTFFAWFFRGEGPARVISGATIQRRFTQGSGSLATFFEDNYAAYVLSCDPGEVEEWLATVVGMTREALREDLRQRSRKYLPRVKRLPTGVRYEAVQAAAIELLKDTPGPHQPQARVVWQERFAGTTSIPPPAEAPAIGDLLGLRTFFTELPKRPELRAALWPEVPHRDWRQDLMERELRRHLLASAARLGHSLIDFYVMTIQRLGSMEAKAREGADDENPETESTSIDQYLDLLAGQRAVPRDERNWAAYDELAEIAANFQLICDTSMADARDWKCGQIGKNLGALLGSQQPVGGMSGKVNQRLVRQFRMPGYPAVLITTDLLQEGEDLHTFCSTIHHYGISWTSSAMEQRIGRIDRVRSQTDRRLGNLPAAPVGADKLQVLFPHLQDTVEVLQVRRVLDRMDVFMRMMHEGLVTAQREESRIDLTVEFERATKPGEQLCAPLRTAFPIRDEHLAGETKDVGAAGTGALQLAARFARLRDLVVPGIPVVWDEASPPGSMLGTAQLATRIQPFAVVVNLYRGWPRLRCVSPVGRVRPSETHDDIVDTAAKAGVRLGAITLREEGSYDLTVEEDVLLAGDDAFDAARFASLLKRVVAHADRLEHVLLDAIDQPLTTFRRDLDAEISNVD